MELLSQLDVAHPDHVSVITREGKVIISVRKDGIDVNIGFPVNERLFNSSPRPPLQQPVPQSSKLLKVVTSNADVTPKAKGKRKHVRYGGPTPKLDEAQVREIKMMVADRELMERFGSTTKGYQEIGKAYKISGCAVANIAKGISWKHVTV